MRKEDMIGLFIYLFPRDFFPPLLELPDFFFFCILCYWFFMAFQTGIDDGHSGEGLGFKEAMACVTLQSLFNMLFVIERDGLISL